MTMCVPAGGAAGSGRYSAAAKAISTLPGMGWGSKSGCGGGSKRAAVEREAVHGLLLQQRGAQRQAHPAGADDDDGADVAALGHGSATMMPDRPRSRPSVASGSRATSPMLPGAVLVGTQDLALAVDRGNGLAVRVRDEQPHLRPLLSQLRQQHGTQLGQAVVLDGGREDGRSS
jgi:hypothetical protein